MYNFRTDLADERRDIFKKTKKIENEIDEIETTEKVYSENLKTTKVKVTNENGAQSIGKPIGNYITIDLKKLKTATEEQIQRASEVLSKELRELIDLHVGKEDPILIVGLGNQYVTPDSLGPKEQQG